MSKKLATIITDIPAAIFHEEDFRIKEMNKEALKEVFDMLEFRSFTKRLLGEDGGALPDQWRPATGNDDRQPTTDNRKAKANTNQLDLFGNNEAAPESSTANESLLQDASPETGSEERVIALDKNINNTPHNYILLNDETAIQQFIDAAIQQTEICFDTETTGLDPNEAELVGLSFSVTKGEAYYVPCPADRNECIDELLNGCFII